MVNSTGTINIRAGVYDESLVDVIPSGYSIDHQLTIQAYGDEVVTLRPSSGQFGIRISGSEIGFITVKNIVVDAINMDSAGVKITTGAHHITLSGVVSKNCAKPPTTTHGFLISDNAHDVTLDQCLSCDNGYGQQSHGIYLSGVDNVVVKRTESCRNSGHGVHAYGGGEYSMAFNYLIERCYLHDNSDRGVGVYYGNAEVLNNIGRGNGINFSARYSIQNAVFANNTSVDGQIAGMDIVSLSAGGDVIVKNTVFRDLIGVWVRGSDNTGSANIENNLFDCESGILNDDPACNLVYTDTGNLLAVFSPLIDDGENIKPLAGNPAKSAGIAMSQISIDYGGNVRGNPPTIGAWE